MATVDLTNDQLDAAAKTPKIILQPAKPAAVYDAAVFHIRKADAASPPSVAGKFVCEVDLGDGSGPVTVAIDDATVLLAAETAAVVRALKRFVVEARSRKGAV